MKASAGTVSFFVSSFLILLAGGAGTAGAVTYYYDNNGATAGFGAAGGTWAAPTPGPTPGWSTDSTGTNAPGSVTTTTSDPLFFGTDTNGLAGGTITISGTQSAGSFTFGSQSGDITLSGGTLNLAASVTINCGQPAGTGAVLDASVTLTGAGTSFAKTGTGKLRVDGGSSLSGTLTFSNGMLVLAGSNSVTMGTLTVNNGNLAANGWLEFQPSGSYKFSTILVNAGNGTDSSNIHLTGGTLECTGNFTMAGGNGGTRYSYAAGGTLKVTGQMRIGNGTTPYTGGSGGTFGNQFIMSGGDVQLGSLWAGHFSTAGNGVARFVMSGGLFRSTGAVQFRNGSVANETDMVLGGGTASVDDSATGVVLGGDGSGNGRVILAGNSTLAAHKVARNTIAPNANPSTMIFHGGTLKALSSNNTDFMGVRATPANGNNALGNSTLNVAYIYAGGATFDTVGFDVTVNPALVPRSVATQTGVGSVTIPGGSQGSGYSIAPTVTFNTPGGGAAAAGYLTLDGSGGIAAVVVADPGSGYSSAATMTLSGGVLGPGGVAATPASWTADMISSTAGGLTKVGAGTLTLASTNNTYTGPTVVSNGTLKVSGAIVGTGVVTVASGGTLGGTGLVAGATTVQAGGTLSAGDGGQGEMTFSGNLTIESGSTSAFDIAVVDLSDRVNVAGTLTIDANAGATLSAHENGHYTLFQYGTLSGSAKNLWVANPNRSKAYKFRSEGSTIILDISEGGTLIVVQ